MFDVETSYVLGHGHECTTTKTQGDEYCLGHGSHARKGGQSARPTPRPLWLKSRHLQRKRYVRAPPESGHSMTSWARPLWANNGHAPI